MQSGSRHVEKLAAAAFAAAALLFGQTPRELNDLLQTGRYAEALPVVNAALAKAPRDAGLLNVRGVIFANTREPTRAREDFEAAVRVDPSMTAAWSNLARLCQSQTAGASCAARAWERVLKLNPADPEARFSLAAAYERQNNCRESLRQLDLLPPNERDRPGSLILRSANLSALGNEREAVESARRAVASTEFLPADATWLLRRMDPSKHAELVAELAPAATSIGDRRRVVQAYESLGRWKDARGALETLAADEPRNIDHLLELGRVAYKGHDLEGALGYLGHARDLAPGDAQVQFLFGSVLMELMLPFEAQKSFEKALSIDPLNPDYNFALGAVLLNTRNAAMSVGLFQKYVAARPSDPQGHLALGRAYFVANDYDSCRQELLKVTGNSPTAGAAAYFLGRVARQEDKFDEAASLFERAIQLLPAFGDSYAELARVRLEQNRPGDARAVIDRALALQADNFEVNLALLSFYKRTHDSRIAEQANRIKELDRERNTKRDKLEQLMMRGVEVRPY